MVNREQPVESVSAPSCISCGGVGTWNPARQDLVCGSCGTAIAVTSPAAGAVDHFPLLPRLRDRPDSGREWQPRATHMRCRSCQSVIACAEHVVGRSCEACGTPALVPSDETGAPVGPSGILPFRKTEAEARTSLAAWLRSQHIRGGATVDTIRRVYLPCWVFNASISCRWRGVRERTDKDGNIDRTPVDGIVERTFDDYLIPASGTVATSLLTSIGPFPAAEMSPYETRYLAGSTVEIYTTNMWEAWDAASARMQAEVDAELKRDSECSLWELETWPEWRDQRCAHALIPVYMISYHHGKKEYQATVNGWTGKIGGTSPTNLLVAFGALAILVAAVWAVGYALYWLLHG